jgi:hypothetical protein
MLVGGCTELPFDIPLIEPKPTTVEGGISIYHDAQPPYYGSSPDKPVKLSNNEAARNPTWSQLLNFLESDDTDKDAYGLSLRVCAEFADTLHDNAEKAGIRASWVALEFEGDSEGHALNAFETTDRGLVFVDCTGLVSTDTVPLASVDTDDTSYEAPSLAHRDRISYVEVGQEYGLIYVEYALSPEYGFYEDYQRERDDLGVWLEDYNRSVTELNQKMETYNGKVDLYDSLAEEYKLKADGRTIIEDPDEYAELSRMHDELERVRLELEPEGTELDHERIRLMQEGTDLEEGLDRLGWHNIEPLGIVSSVEIYW